MKGGSPGKSLLGALAALCLSLAAPAAAGPPGVWTEVQGDHRTNREEVTTGRAINGLLFVPFVNSRGELVVSRVTDNRLIDANVAVQDTGSVPPATPAFLRHPNGRLRLLFGGSLGAAGSGTFSVNAVGVDAERWSRRTAKVANLAGPVTVAVSAVDPAGFVGTSDTVFIGRGGDDLLLHRGLDPGSPDHRYQSTCCSEQLALTADGARAAPYLGWVTGSPPRLTIREGSADTGEPVGPAVQAPGTTGAPAEFVGDQAVAIRGLDRFRGGIYAAYVDRADPRELLLWRVGDPAPAVAATARDAIHDVVLTSLGEGSLVLLWREDRPSGRDEIAARRLVPDGTSLGPINRYDVPSSGDFVQLTGNGADVVLQSAEGELFHTQSPFRLGPPVPGENFNAVRRAFGVLVAEPGREFVRLRQEAQLPVGTILDTDRGSVRLTMAANSDASRLHSGVFSGGEFQVRQDASSRLPTLRLRGGSTRRCRIRSLRASTFGRFRTRGRYALANGRGARWTMTDRCDGTLTKVGRGSVIVTDFGRDRSVRVEAGERYLARRR